MTDETDDQRRANSPVMASIITLEMQQCRAVREHLLGDPTAKGRLQAIDGLIVALRAKLV